MLLTTYAIHKSYGPNQILEDISFVLNATDRVGIVGPNGVGKSTLLRIITGQEEADSGAVTFAPNCEFGYLAQTLPDLDVNIEELVLQSVGNLKQLEERMHVLERAMAQADSQELEGLLEEYTLVSTRFQDRGGYEIDYKIDVIFTGLRIDYLPRTQSILTLSGGEKARVGLATLLLRSPDILLLDEPTNHLDFASITWLENYLQEYRGAVLMVSHDRQFLNKTVNRIFEIDEHSKKLLEYVGNYDAYVVAKQLERKRWTENYERQQEEIKELRKRIRVTGRQLGHNNRPTRDNDKFTKHFFAQNQQNAVASNIRAAQVQLERLEKEALPKPPELMTIHSHIQAEPIQSDTIFRVSKLSKQYGGRTIMKDLTLTLGAQTRILLTGPNGVGKTTFLKLLCGQIAADSGEVHTAEGASIGYLAQEPATFAAEQTVLEAYKDGQIGYEGEFIGRLLGYGLFRLEDMHKKVGQLSVGQRRKLEIARLMANKPNVLLLDEPTNYISLDILEAFEASLHTFPGPIIAISHDRWFIEQFQGEVWEMYDGQLTPAKSYAL